MNKILIADPHRENQKKLEQILEPILQGGGELFFAETRELALQILEKEHPRITFLDISLVGDDADAWVKSHCYIVLMQERESKEQISEDYLLKPFTEEQVLEKCRDVLEVGQAPEIPPM